MREPAFWWRKAGLACTLLAPAAACYGAIAAGRMRRRGTQAGVPVICVGNFTLGGTGKTPTAIAIAEMLSAAGERPFLLTRGYGGREAGPRLVNTEADSAAEVGDEALLLARAVPTVVARDRVAGAALARQLGATAIVLDDGLQNASLHKDFTLTVVDAERGFGNGRGFPAGPLRAPLPAQLARSDALLLVGGELPRDLSFPAAKQPVFHARLIADAATLERFRGRRILAFAGIGHPEKFFAILRAAGLQLAQCRAFPDHHRFTAGEAADLVKTAQRESLLLLTTEKDRARMIGDPVCTELAAHSEVLPVRMEFSQRDELRDRLLAAIKRGR